MDTCFVGASEKGPTVNGDDMEALELQPVVDGGDLETSELESTTNANTLRTTVQGPVVMAAEVLGT